jgi:hypothetical protein
MLPDNEDGADPLSEVFQSSIALNSLSLNQHALTQELEKIKLLRQDDAWIMQLFKAQQEQHGASKWIPIKKYLPWLAIELRTALTGNANTAVAKYLVLLHRFPFEYRYYERLDYYLRQMDDPKRYIITWLECVESNPEIAPYAAKKILEAATLWLQQQAYESAGLGLLALRLLHGI